MSISFRKANSSRINSNLATETKPPKALLKIGISHIIWKKLVEFALSKNYRILWFTQILHYWSFIKNAYLTQTLHYRSFGMKKQLLSLCASLLFGIAAPSTGFHIINAKIALFLGVDCKKLPNKFWWECKSKNRYEFWLLLENNVWTVRVTRHSVIHDLISAHFFPCRYYQNMTKEYESIQLA